MTTHTLDELLSLTTPAIAISFVATAGVKSLASSEAASCSYWRRAAAGEVFATEARHHLGCAVGAHTHGVATTPEQKGELTQLVKTMVGLGYLTMEDVPAIAHRTDELQVVVYSPFAKAPCPPDLVLVRGDVRQLMLLTEAAHKAGVGSGIPTMGRPTCAVLPQALQSGKTSSSFGCVGNRLYTGAGDGEGWFAIPAAVLPAVVASLQTVVRANDELKKFHQHRADGNGS